jgi:soluble lytic murein transglycosylase-like protein
MTPPVSCCKRLVWLMAWALPLAAQPARDADEAVARQRQAAAAMQGSLAKQRAAVRQQMGTNSGDDFFTLPRAASLGGVTATVASPAPAAMPVTFGCDPLPAPEIDSLVGTTADRDGVNADLLRTVMKQESGFRPCAVSSKGAMGLMQLMPSTAEQLGIHDPFDAASNVDGGARFLKQLLERYGGDIPKALGAYNAGPSRVDAAGTVPSIPETMDYVRQILAALPFH